VNVQCPKVPLLSDGKAPDLGPIAAAVMGAVEAAARAAARTAGGGSAGGKKSQKDIIRGLLVPAVAPISSDGRMPFLLRQLFYAMRPDIKKAIGGTEPNYDTFTRIIADIEDAQGFDLPNLCRDNRGTLYTPHTKTEIPLGTLSVGKYTRPPLTFNNVLYIEKEGFRS